MLNLHRNVGKETKTGGARDFRLSARESYCGEKILNSIHTKITLFLNCLLKWKRMNAKTCLQPMNAI